MIIIQWNLVSLSPHYIFCFSYITYNQSRHLTLLLLHMLCRYLRG